MKAKESQVEKLLKTIEKNNQAFFGLIAESESMLNQSLDEAIKVNTRKIMECFDKEVEKVKSKSR